MSYINQDILDGSYKNSYNNIKNHILYSLGYPLVRIELTEEHLILAIVEAISHQYDNAADDKDLRIVPVEEDNTVTIPSDIYEERIEDIIFPTTALDSFSRGLGLPIGEGEGSIFAYGTQRDILDNFDLASYLLYCQRLGDIRDALCIEKYWEKINDRIILYPRQAEYDRVGILYKGLRGEKQYEQDPWIKAYALARAKHILGTIRSKMSGYQAANANIAQDGEALKSEAKEEMTALMEELNKNQAPMPFITI